MLKKSTILFFLGVLCLPICIFAQSKIIYVNTAATGTNDGSSWQNAFKDLQDALQIAKKPDAIWIAKGTYFPTKTNDRSISYDMKNGVSIYGGFEGNETSAAKRDFEKNKTILSGNIGNATDSLDNSYRLVNAIDIQDVTYLDGVEIAYGNANLSSNIALPTNKGLSGAGLYVTTTVSLIASKLEVTNCKIYNNFSKYYGGGIFFDCSKPDKMYINVKKCKFYNNIASGGGAIMITENNPLSITIDSCSFISNDINSLNAGGGLLVEIGTGKEFITTIKNSYFENNKALGGSGGHFCFKSFNNPSNYYTININNSFFGKCKNPTTAIYVYSKAELNINSCYFTKTESITSNTSADIKVSNSIFFNNGRCILGGLKVLKNCVFYKNNIVNDVRVPNGEVIYFDNNLFIANSNIFTMNGALKAQNIYLRNSIFINNSWSVQGDDDIERFKIQNSILDAASQINKYGKNIFCDSACIFNVNPLFTDTSKFDFHLLPCSPAINAGNNAYATGNTSDLDGKPRIAHKKIDIGPYEFQDFKINTYAIKPTFCTSKQGSFLPIFKGNCSNSPTITWENAQKQTGNGGEKLSGGVYTFFVKDTNGCADTLKNITIEDKGVISADFNIFNTSGTNAKNGSITVKNVNNGKAPFKYVWSNGDTTKTIQSLKAGDYNLTITDANGCVFSTTLTVKVASATSDLFLQNISATPNPASEKITFNYDVSQFEKELFVTFYDLQGKIILAKQKIKNKEEIDVSTLAKGLYFWHITDNQYFTKINKIVIQ